MAHESKRGVEDVLMDLPDDLSKSCFDELLLFKENEFSNWYDELMDAHFRERRGSVELPRDADGVRWTGKETEFVTENGKAFDLDTFCYHARGGRWSIHGHTMTGSIESYNPSDCRHVPAEPADPHAELADELDIFASTRISDKDDASMLQDIADRLRKIGGGQ